MMYHLTNPCSCGSGLQRRAVVDGHGCFLFYACDQCEKSKLSRYRPDILSSDSEMDRYECDEPIEPEE